MHTEPNEGEVARWMYEAVKNDGELYQEDAVASIEELFGDKFTYTNDHGHPAISSSVLNLFRGMTKTTVTWSKSEKYWEWGNR